MPRKRYAYEVYETTGGERKVRRLPRAREARGDFDFDYVSASRDAPGIRKQKMAYYETGIMGIGDKTGGDYTDTILWGKQGGRPRKWANEAERKRATRAQAKLEQGQPLTQPEKELLGLIKKRPGAYKSPLGRPMTPAERQRARRAKLKAEQAELAWLEEGL